MGWPWATSTSRCADCWGEAAPLSASSIARLKAGWQAEYETWKGRRLDELEPVYVWADGIYVKAGLEKDKAALLVRAARAAALRDGRKVVLAVESGYRESTESWAAVLRDLKARGLRAPRLLIADGHLGIWSAVGTVFPTMREQRCWNHRLVNVLDTLPQKLQTEARALLTKIPYAETRAGAERLKRGFQVWATQEGRGRGGPSARGGLGAAGDLLCLPKGALEAPADHKRGGVAVRDSTASDGGGQAVQEGGERNGDHLEDPAGCRTELPPARCAGASPGGCRGRRVRRRRAGAAAAVRRPPPDLVYTLLDKTSSRSTPAPSRRVLRLRRSRPPRTAPPRGWPCRWPAESWPR